MLNVNPGNSSKLASSVQHDYEQAAADYRLIKASGYRPNRASSVKIGLALTTLVAAVATISQLI